MTAALIAALLVTVTGCLVLVDRKDARAKLERDADREERQILLQRIQAPQIAVVDHSQERMSEDPETFPLSDREIAERQEAAAALAFIERFENPGGDE